MDWSKIDSVAFEKLCFEYARREYSEFEWESTSQSWDGNKDGEFREEIRKLNRVVKGWFEAKYTYDASNSIPKSHMDSTLVSGILDGEVVFILFITNGRITSDFRKRAFAILSPHRIDVSFVDGDILENWLMQNPSIFDEFFQEQVYNKQNSKAISIEDVCIYEALFSSPNFINPIKALTVSREYFVYLGVKATGFHSFKVDLFPTSLEIMNQRIYSVNPGYNSILLHCIAKTEEKKAALRVSLLKDKSDFELCHAYVRDISVNQSSIPTMVYFNQDKVLHEMHDYIRLVTNYNSLLILESRGGMGKSYIIRSLISEIAAENCMYMIGYFSDKASENACLLCKLILFLSFGTLFELDESAFIIFASKYVTIPVSLLISLRNGTRNQIVALSAIKAYSDYVFQHEGMSFYIGSCIEHLFSRSSYIILEDCHKLSRRYAQLLNRIITEYMGSKHSQVLLISCRSNEGNAKYFENIKSTLHCMSWKLHGLSMTDVGETMQLHFGERIRMITSALPLPESILQLSMIVKELKDCNICSIENNLIPQRVASIYKRVNFHDNHYVIERMEHSAHQSVIALIYIVENGIPLELLREYLNGSEVSAVDDLLNDQLIRIENNLLKPYHDYYISAYNTSSICNTYNNVVSDFLAYCVHSPQNTEIIESVLTAVLLSYQETSHCDCKMLYDRYISLYKRSNYEATCFIGKKLLSSKKLKEHFDYEEICYIRYIYAQSIKATCSHSVSNYEFKALENSIQLEGGSSQQLGILYDCLSEIVNNDLWMFEFSELESYLNRLRNLKPSKNSPQHLINAYLNYHNRSMMYYSFINISCRVNEYYNSSIKESIRLSRPDYLAYAKMDYAKTLYISAPRKALFLLYEAHSFFISNETYRRRKLDCESEIAFLQSILDNASVEVLYGLSREMLSHHYIHSYFKTCVKLLYLEFIEYRDNNMVSAKLDVLLTRFPESSNEMRQSLYVGQLRYMLSFFATPEIHETRKKTTTYESILHKLGADYSFAFNHNKTLLNTNTTSIAWLNFGDKNTSNSNCFLLDPRIW